ncbi:MAG: HAMP domain-containing protein [Phycisphaerae bacterium]|nr:HAMP domain-containing protein [Phycisphaerae bacterium]
MKSAPGKFFWKLFLSNAALLAVVVGASVWIIHGRYQAIYTAELTDNLRAIAEALRQGMADRSLAEDTDRLDRLAKGVGFAGSRGIRVTLVSADGTVVADSEADPAHMVSHSDRPEIQEALRNGWGVADRWSDTLSCDMRYVAARVGPADAPRGVVRVSMGVRRIESRTTAARNVAILSSAVVLAGAVMLALALARIWSGRIARITAAAQSISTGDLSARVQVSGSDEVSLLARSLNQMRDHLARQMETIDRHSRTLEYLLAQLHEGVIVAGPNGEVLLMNPAARRLLDVQAVGDTSSPGGGPIEECIPHDELQRMLRVGAGTDTEARDVQPPIEEYRLTVQHGGRAVTLLARASDIVLPGADDATAGARRSPDESDGLRSHGRLLVLTDVTELTHALQIKTDFVANASHELRTPLSAIRAAVETLISMSGDDASDSAPKLLKIIDRHSGRLEAMVTDLLDLSRLESPGTESQASAVPLPAFLQDLHDRFREKLVARGLHWQVDLGPGCETVFGSRHLLSLILDNLVHNAVKFTDEGGHVTVSGRRMAEAVALSVEDDGCGIPPEEQSRVFERFYQVQRARSGPTRGTGLGLSIVRHAVDVMNGHVTLESEPGRGTRITVTIPQAIAPHAARQYGT